MPYIEKEPRKDLDPLIDNLIAVIKSLAGAHDNPTAYAGLLNYACTRLAVGVIPEQRYFHIATVSGVLQNVSAELYRRYAAPYEDVMMSKHGDVREYEGASRANTEESASDQRLASHLQHE